MATPNELVEMLRALEPEERAATLNALVSEVLGDDYKLSASEDLAKLTSALRKERAAHKEQNRQRARLQEELDAYQDENGHLVDLKGLLARERAVEAREAAVMGIEGQIGDLQAKQAKALSQARVALDLSLLGIDPGSADPRLLSLAADALATRTEEQTPADVIGSDPLLAQLMPPVRPTGAPMTAAGSLYSPEPTKLEAMQSMDAQAQFIAAFAES